MRKFFKIVKNFIRETDKILLLLCMITSAFGCISVLSATHWTLSEGEKYTRDFIVMVLAVCLGLIISLIISLIDYEFIIRMSPIIGLFCIAIMGITLLFGVGPEERPDAKTWLKIGNTGIFFQPSEIVKIGFIITFGVHIERLKSKINHPLSILQLLIHALIPIGLVVISGDMGSALVFMIITVVMLFLSGLHWGYFLGGGLLLLASLPLVWIFVFDKIQKDRFLALINPELYQNISHQ